MTQRSTPTGREATLHVLLVEDDPALAETTARALRSQGWQVDHTARGEPVAASVKADPYDLLILDIGLVGIDGFEALRRVRAEFAWSVLVDRVLALYEELLREARA